MTMMKMVQVVLLVMDNLVILMMHQLVLLMMVQLLMLMMNHLVPLVMDPFGDVGDDPFGDLGDDPFGHVGDDPFDDVGDYPFGDVVVEPIAYTDAIYSLLQVKTWGSYFRWQRCNCINTNNTTIIIIYITDITHDPPTMSPISLMDSSLTSPIGPSSTSPICRSSILI